MLTGYSTIIAAAIALLGEIGRQVGIDFDTDGLVNAVMVIGGTIGAIYYRTKAEPK
jgi:hypothetical protein